ncbi:MAG: GLUG motif-containing protein [Planctomycetota bacterium]|jgi:hypothetical protein
MYRARISSLLGKITVVVVICSFCLPVQAKYGGGTGEPNDPYLIYTAEQMNEIGLDGNWGDRDKCFRLMADIDLSSYTGTEFNLIMMFTGVFDGNGHTISNFTYASNDRNPKGLFLDVSFPNAEIKNLGLIDAKVDAGTGEYVGSLVGILYYGTITDCYVEGGSVSGGMHVGGLVGQNTNGTITNCDSSCEVSSRGIILGGLVGINEYGTITNCRSSGKVTGSFAGGLVGLNESGTITNCDSSSEVLGDSGAGGLVSDSFEGKIANCFATGSVEGLFRVGGLVSSGENITNCYATGDVSGDVFVGGLAGYGANITNCYATGSVSGLSGVGGLVGTGGNITNC